VQATADSCCSTVAWEKGYGSDGLGKDTMVWYFWGAQPKKPNFWFFGILQIVIGFFLSFLVFGLWNMINWHWVFWVYFCLVFLVSYDFWNIFGVFGFSWFFGIPDMDFLALLGLASAFFGFLAFRI
jgi:hypothetical protein